MASRWRYVLPQAENRAEVVRAVTDVDDAVELGPVPLEEGIELIA